MTDHYTIYNIAGKLAFELSSQPSRDALYHNLVIKRLLEITDNNYQHYDEKLTEIENKLNYDDIQAVCYLLNQLSSTYTQLMESMNDHIILPHI